MTPAIGPVLAVRLSEMLRPQIPAPRQHLVRYYGWYGNRDRGARKEHGVEDSGAG